MGRDQGKINDYRYKREVEAGVRLPSLMALPREKPQYGCLPGAEQEGRVGGAVKIRSLYQVQVRAIPQGVGCDLAAPPWYVWLLRC